ncbi:MAG: glycosyltransferase, partial [Bacteroidaceae bacterium]|nr:glycosyltransferase [Bacteroidaceae bacterium]
MIVLPLLIGIIAYTLLYFMKWRYYRLDTQSKFQEAELATYTFKITIVIPTSNQAQQLEQLITRLLEQNYKGGIEIIVVLYANTDNTPDLLKKLEYDHRNIRHTTVPGTAHFIDLRKLAITIGIKSVRTEWFALLDPQFIPSSTDWLTSLSCHIREGFDLIIGYENFATEDNTGTVLRYMTHRNFLQLTRKQIPAFGNFSNFIVRKNALNLNALYDVRSLQFTLGSISNLLLPLFRKNAEFVCTQSQAAGMQLASTVEINDLKTRLAVEQELLTETSFNKKILKFIQASLIFIYIIITIFYGVAATLFALTLQDALAQPSFLAYFATPLSITNNIVICTTFFLLQ